MKFGKHLAEVVADSAPCCVGIDPHENQVPFDLSGKWCLFNLTTWGIKVIDAVERAGIRVVKPQSALFEQFGPVGVQALRNLIGYARSKKMVVILDAKRGDIGSTALGYCRAAYQSMGANSVTLNPYLGPESLLPFRQYFEIQSKLPDTGCGPGAWVLVRTSNPGAAGWQLSAGGGIALKVAAWLKAANASDDLGDFGAVIGATIPQEEMQVWRQRLPHTWFLLPGYGAQGASASDCLAGFREDRTGGLVVSARGVLFPPPGTSEDDWEQGVFERAKAFADDVQSVL